jgi:hypothetical protein
VLLKRQRSLEARLESCKTAGDILRQGEALLRFSELEGEALSTLFDLVEPSVRAELAAQHREFAEDLGLLDWLMRTVPDSPDTATLAASLGRRLRDRLARDGRLLQRALTMTG